MSLSISIHIHHTYHTILYIYTLTTPLTNKYSCISSTSLFLSQKIITGGAVFCKHSNKYTIFASLFTYSTSCMTSKFAAPARPTLISKGWTKVFLAKS